MHSLLPALVPAIGWALLHFLWQGLLIGCGTSLALNLLRGARPQTRYAVACAAMLLCAALPLACIVAHLGGSGMMNNDLSVATSYPAPHAIDALPLLPDAARVSSWTFTVDRQLPWIVLLWSCGAALMALRLSIGLQWVGRHTGADQYRIDHDWQARLARLARRFEIPRHVRLGVTELLDSPITAGCWRPIVLVPAALVGGMPPDLLEALLAHELAHIKRHDYLINLIQSVIEIVLFYHPSVWALSRRIRTERELIADDLAVGMLGEPQRLAHALSELDRFQFATTQLAHAAHGGNLMSRIKRLLRSDAEPLSWKMALPLLGLCAAGAVLYAHAAPSVSVADGIPAPGVSVPATPAMAAAAPAIKAAPAAPVTPAAPAAPAAPLASPAPPAPPAPPVPPSGAIIPAPPAPPALPAIPAATAASQPAGMSWHGRVAMNDGRDAYALVRGDSDSVSISGSKHDMVDIAQLRQSVKGGFLWFRNDGKSYLIQDPATLAKAAEAWRPVEQLGKQMEEQGAQMAVYGKAMGELGGKMNAPAASDTRALERQAHQMERLAHQQEGIVRRLEREGRKLDTDQNGAEREASQHETERLHAQMQALEGQMRQLRGEMSQQQGKLQVAQQPAQAIGRQMRELEPPMKELGAKMHDLGHEQAEASRAAERTMRALIQQALKNGSAVPAPAVGGKG